MNTQHTPGPWKSDDQTGIVFTDHQGFAICQTDGSREIQPYWDSNLERTTANARLIAASPDLLEALKVVLKDFEQWPCKPSTEKLVQQAINKATGK